MAHTPSADARTSMPMVATVQPAPVSLDILKQIVAQLSVPAQLKKLATNVRFLKQQTGLIHSATGHLQQACSTEQGCKQLLAKAPQMLRQLVTVTTAVLQQLAKQRDSEVKVSQAAAMLIDSLAWLLQWVRARPDTSIFTPSAPADVANLRMLQDTGLLKAFSAAATAAVSFFASNPQLPRADPTTPAPRAAGIQLTPNQHAAVLLMNDPAHMFAAASNSLLLLWNAFVQLMPTKELLSAHSLLRDTALPAVQLAMALARAYAGDKVFCSSVMPQVLAASCTFTSAGSPGTTGTHSSVLACWEVSELLLLGLAVGTGLLYAEQKGVSTQSLPPSMRATSSAPISSSTSVSGSSPASSSKRLAVSAHHEELLQALVGVRQLAALQDFSAVEVTANMWLFPLAVNHAQRARIQDAIGSGGASSLTPPSVKRAVQGGEVVPWQLALPVLLTQLELLALAPHYLTAQLALLPELLGQMASGCQQFGSFTCPHHWEPGQQPPNWPPFDTVQSHLQQCVQSTWLQLGPALLVLCRRSNGEEEEGPGNILVNPAGQRLGPAEPRRVFAFFSEMLLSTVAWSGPPNQHSPTVDLAAIVEHNPLLAAIVMEAALRVAPDFKGPPSAAVHASCNNRDRMVHASITCFQATAALPCLAKATAETAAAAAVASSDSSQLEQKMLGLVVAALKHAQYSAALTRSAASLDAAVLGSYYNSILLLLESSRVAIRILGPPGGPELNREQQLLWLQVLGRVLVAAGPLLLQVPQFVSSSGGFFGSAGMFLPFRQFKQFMDAVIVLDATSLTMLRILYWDGAAAAAVEAGSPAAAATPAGLVRLRQQAEGLQQALKDFISAFQASAATGGAGAEGQDAYGGEAAMQQLHAACQEGGLPQQLHSFGVACCAAFPQRGCCGNPACINLDKFAETALASQGCSGCDKAVKFCSAAFHKTAWKQGHKAACAVLKQRHAAGGAAAASNGS